MANQKDKRSVRDIARTGKHSRAESASGSGKCRRAEVATPPTEFVWPRLFGRQNFLLSLLWALGGRAEKVEFQKWLFLCCRDLGGEAPYEFVPCSRGAFSFTSHADRRKLIREGLLVDNKDYWTLTSRGRQVARTLSNSQVTELAQKYRKFRGNALIAQTYRVAPYYAIRSKIMKQVLRRDFDTRERVLAAHPKGRAAPLATIGYESRSLEAYLNKLIRAGVTVLCDVRRNPISRRYGFAKSTLADACREVGIEYRHVPELGIPSENRRNLETQADYDRLFRQYKKQNLVRQDGALAKIRGWISEGERVALTCYELHHKQCHRHCVSDALERIRGRRIVARHL